LNLLPTDELSTSCGDMKAYDYFSDKKSLVSDNDIQALFRLKIKNQPDNLMKVWVKGSEEQKIYTANAPKSNALTKGTAPIEMLGKPMPTLIVKREEASWNNPFALVFNPFIEGGKNPIDDVTFTTLPETPNAQIIEVKDRDKKTVDRIIANSSENDIAFEKGFYQKGLFSVIRESQVDDAIEFLFVSGMYKLEYKEWQILSTGKALSLSIERIEDGYLVENDQAVVIKMPYVKGDKIPQLIIYEDGKIVSQRIGIISRFNPHQVEFRLSKAHNDVVISTR